MTPTPKPGVLDIAPYVGGRASVAGVAEPIKLSSNESALGPSPMALAAYEAAAKCVCDLPRRQRAASCARPSARPMASTPSRIVCGNGSDEL